MVKKLFILAFIGLCGLAELSAQAIVKGAGTLYTDGPPTHTVNINVDAETAIDTASGLWYERSRDGLGWIPAGFRIQKLASSSPPSGAPLDKQSEVVLNDVDSLYRWRGGAWRHINKVVTYSAGTGISITGFTINNTGDLLTNNEGILGVGSGSGTSAVILSNTTGATGVTIQASTGIGVTESTSSNGGTITITNSAPDQTVTISNGGGVAVSGTYPTFTLTATDQSTTNEVLTISDGTNSEAMGGQTLVVAGAGINVAVYSPGTNTLTITGTEIDGSTTNEGSLTVTAGSGTTSVIHSNTSGSTDITITASTGLTISESGNTITLVNSSPDQTVSITNGGGIAVSGTYPNFTLTATDQSTTNEVLTISDGTNSEAMGGQTLTVAGAGISVAVYSPGTNTLTITSTEVDGSITNEALTVTDGTNSEALGGQTLTVAGAGINVAVYTPGTNTLTITGTEVDGNVANEGSLTVTAGSGTTSVIHSNTSGSTDVTITASTGLTIAESGNTITLTNSAPDQTVSITNGGGISVSGTYPNFTLTATDQSITNEALTVTDGTNSEALGGQTLTVAGGGINTAVYNPGTNTLTITGNEVDGSTTNEVLTISDGTDSEALGGQTLTVVGAGGATADYDPGTNTLTITASGGGGGGITSLNGLTAGTQTFATGTAGTDFGISSATSTHTFNLPTASASNRGALSSADWSTFNSKVGGSGTTAYLPKWASSSTLTDSKFFETSNTVSLGTNTGIDSYTRLFIYGGGSGANVDARGLPSTGIDQATFDAQASDYSTSFRSVHIRFLGPNSVGTTLGQSNVNLGDLTFNDPATAIIQVAGTAPIRLGINGTEVGQISSNGIETRTGKAFRLNDSDNTNYVAILPPATASLTANYTLTLPVDDGTADQYMKTDGSGGLSWATDGDGSATNEGSLTVTAGSGTTSVIHSNTSGSTDVTITASTGLTISESGNTITLTNSAPDQTVTLTNGGGVAVSGTYPNFTLTATDQSTTNEVLTITDGTNSEAMGGQTLTVAGAGINVAVYTPGTNTLTITGTEVDGSVTNEGSLTVTAGSGTTSVIHSNTSGSTDVTITASTGLTISESGNTITLVNSAPDQTVSLTNGGGVAVSGTYPNFTLTATDQSTTNEVLTISDGTNSEAMGGQTLTVAGAGINVATYSPGTNTLTITGTEVDGSTTNEGSLTVTAGSGTTSVIHSNTSGSTDVTITASTGLSIAESGNTITLTNSAPDQTVVLNNGTGITVTGTYPNFTINASGAGSSIYTASGTAFPDVVVTVNAGNSVNFSMEGEAGSTFSVGDINNDVVGDGFQVYEDGAKMGDIFGSGDYYIYSGKGVAGNYIRTPASNLIQGATNTDWTIIGGYFKFTDSRVTKSGIGYMGNYSTDIRANDRNIPDVGTVKDLFVAGTNITFTPVGNTIEISAAGSSGGITSLNGLTGATQTFATGTAGTDFGISSSGTTHTFNIPTASASNRGALSSADWTTFNNKDGSVTNEGDLTVTAGSGTTSVIHSNTSGSTDVTITASTGLTIAETGNTITLTNSAPDQTVSLTNGGGVAVSGTYPNFTLTATDQSITNEVLTVSDGTDSEALGGQTLTFAASGSATVDYNPATNTLTVGASSGGSPAGANYQVQYYDTGAFGANANFNFNPTTKRLVVGTTTPVAVLHARGQDDVADRVFLAENSSANDVLAIYATGRTKWGDNETYPYVYQSPSAGGTGSYTANGLTFQSDLVATTGVDLFSFFHPASGLTTGGPYSVVKSKGTWQPTSGSAIYTSFTADPTINATSTASGMVSIFNGIPTITQATGGVNVFNASPSVTAASGGLRGYYSNIASGTGLYQIFMDGTAQSRFDGPVGIKADPVASTDLYVVGNSRFDAQMLIRGAGTVQSTSAAAALSINNTTSGDTWYFGQSNDGTMYIGSGNASQVIKGQTDGTVETIYDLQVDFLNGTPTKVAGVDGSGLVGEVLLGSGVTLSAGELPLWGSADAGSITSLTATALANVTGMTFSVTNGLKYEFWAAVVYSAAATTTGSAWSMDCPTGSISIQVESALTNSTTFDHWQNAENTLLASASSAYTSLNLAYVRGVYSATASGTCQLRGATEVASSAITVQGSSNINWREIK